MSLIPRDSLFDLDNLFGHFFSPSMTKELSSGFFSPRVDIKEAKDKYEIIADLPGVEKEDLSVTLENGVLTIEASTSKEDVEEKEGRVIRKERRSGKYMRSFNLGAEVHEGDIEASFKNGVLSLSVPKAEEVVPEPRQIEIH